MQSLIAFIGLCIVGTMAQMPSACQTTCVTTNTANSPLFGQMFSGNIAQSDYNNVCSAISNIQTCLNQCASQNGSQNVAIATTNAPVTSPDYQQTDSSATIVTSTPTMAQNASITDCLSGSLPIYTSACSAGYQQYSQLGACFSSLNAGFAAAKQTCQTQCATANNTNNGRRRRRGITVTTFCMTNCGLSQQLSAIRQQCSPWVSQFAQIVATSYNNLYQLSPSCLTSGQSLQ